MHAQWSGDSKFSYRSNALRGNKNQSFLKEKSSVIEELGFNSIQNFNPRSRFDFSFRGRGTDDDRIESKKFGLLRLNSTLVLGGFSVSLGDVLPEFTEFSISQGLKGGVLKHEFSLIPGFSLQTTGGSTASSWRRLWDERTSEYKQYVYGARAQQEVKDFTFAAGTVYAADDPDSVQNPTVAARQNSVINFDFQGKIRPGWKIEGEAARSQKNYDSGQLRTAVASDYAYRMETRIRVFNPASLTVKYYRVEPNFESLAGSVLADSEQWKTLIRHEYSPALEQNISYNYRQDNLRETKSARTYVHAPESRWDWKVFQYLNANWGARFESRKKTDGSRNERNWSAPAGIRFSGGSLGLGLNYEYRDQKDDVSAGASHAVHVAGGQVSFKKISKGLTLDVFGNYQVNYDRDRITNTIDASQNVAGGFGFVLSNALRFNVQHDNSIFDSNKTSASDSLQNSTTAMLGYDFTVFKNRSSIEFRFSRKDLDYQNVSTNNYTENLSQVDFITRF